jgi:hypothetical protein
VPEKEAAEKEAAAQLTFHRYRHNPGDRKY